jgi:flagellar hook assembly protein FlgD
VLNFPNPFTTKTAFYFEHNQNCNFLDVSILIYSVSGKVVKRINKRILNEGFRSQGISWDGKDDFNEDLARGVYVYNLRVTNEQGLSADKTQTMFLLK